MNFLKRKWILYRLQSFPALPESQVCDQLRPFAIELGLTFTNKGIRFPKILSTDQRAVLDIIYCKDQYKESIPYKDIIATKYFPQGIKIKLRNGYIFHFIEGSPVWYVSDPLKCSEPSRLTAAWWKLSGWITLQWWKLSGRGPKDLKE